MNNKKIARELVVIAKEMTARNAAGYVHVARKGLQDAIFAIQELKDTEEGRNLPSDESERLEKALTSATDSKVLMDILKRRI